MHKGTSTGEDTYEGLLLPDERDIVKMKSMERLSTVPKTSRGEPDIGRDCVARALRQPFGAFRRSIIIPDCLVDRYYEDYRIYLDYNNRVDMMQNASCYGFQVVEGLYRSILRSGEAYLMSRMGVRLYSGNPIITGMARLLNIRLKGHIGEMCGYETFADELMGCAGTLDFVRTSLFYDKAWQALHQASLNARSICRSGTADLTDIIEEISCARSCVRDLSEEVGRWDGYSGEKE